MEVLAATVSRRARALAGILLLLAGGISAAAETRPIVPSEYAVKAAFLYNFAKFVEWPAGTFSSPREAVAFCIVGEDALGDELAQAVAGKMVQNRPVAIRRAAQLEELGGCQILFVGSSERARFDRLLAAVGRRPILTVGDEEEFRQAGGIINFVLRRNRVRFQIDLEAAERAGLRISARLLELAEVVPPANASTGSR
jgi:hypothetical protein